MAGQAYAKEATDKISTAFSSDSFARQDKTRGDWADDMSNLPSGFTTLVTMRPNIIVDQDRHTVAFAAEFLTDATYAASYYVLVNSASAGALKNSAGLVRSMDGVAITTVLPNIPFSLPATPTSTALMTLGGANDMGKAASGSEISRASGSFLEQLPVPEPGAVELMGTGILVLAGAVRRRNSK